MDKSQSKGKFYLKTGLVTAASIGLYVALFANEGTVMKLFTKGGAYVALPVLTAFAFSVVHGACASQILEALGISASSSAQKSIQAAKQKKAEQRKDQRPRLQAN